METNKSNSNNQVVKNFSEMTTGEQIKKLEKRNLNYKRELREVTEQGDRAQLFNAIRETTLLIDNLRYHYAEK